MRITILGKSPAWQDAGGACSAYLIEEGPTTLLLDCGNGAFGKLRQHVDYVDVDAVVLSHLHADHFFDLVPFASALTYAPRQQPVPVDRWPGTDHAGAARAPRARRRRRRPSAASARAAGCPRTTSRAPSTCASTARPTSARGRAPAPALQRGPALPCRRSRSRSAPPPTAPGAWPTPRTPRPSDELVEFARGADLLLIEATLPRPERGGVRGHLTPGEAGEHGRRAAVGRIVLTHISDELDAAWAQEQAADAFDGEVVVAAEGAVFEV